MLRLGRRFDAVRLPEALVHAAVETKAAEDVAIRLARRLDGPVIYDGRAMGGTYYALMRSHGAPVWEHEDTAPRLSAGSYLGVPRPGHIRPPGIYWVVPPRFEGHLCERTRVAALVVAGWNASEGAKQR
ncbi:hypothetical protein SALBM135S_02764 [Streptomyces alboniger]